MKILIMTVQHSGTGFLLKFLVGVLGLDGESGAHITEQTNVDFWHTHPNPTVAIPDIFDACIVTLRHPYKSMTTAKFVGDKGQILTAWAELIKQQKKYETTLFLTIDGPEENRFPQLMAIAKHFGKEHLEPAIREYADDWSPVNQSLTEDDLNAAIPAVAAYKQWS